MGGADLLGLVLWYEQAKHGPGKIMPPIIAIPLG